MGYSYLALLPVLLTLLTSATLAQECVPPAPPNVPPTLKFCLSPPTERISLPLYSGFWYNIFNSGIALQLVSGTCVTANYTVLPNNGLAVLNCNQPDKSGPSECVRAVASRRLGKRSPGKLQIRFPSLPTGLGNPGNYNVAAVLGNRGTGYYAAAVYTCTKVGDKVVDGYFILSRTTAPANLILNLLRKKLRCKGYDVSKEFIEMDQMDCQYFFDADI